MRLTDGIRTPKRGTRRTPTPRRPRDLTATIGNTPDYKPDYKQPLTPNRPSRPSVYKPEVWSSSDSLDIDDVLATPIELSDSSLIKIPLPVREKRADEFQIKSTRGVTTRRNKFQESAPNTVGVTRRNIPGNKGLANRYSSPASTKRWVYQYFKNSYTVTVIWYI